MTTLESKHVYQTITLNRHDVYAVVTINRPRQLNALNADVRGEIGRALDDLEDDTSIRAVIITGSGDRAFSAGADIAELEALESAEDGTRHSRAAHELLFRIERYPKPVIMAVNGYALGGGMELAMGGDIILASDNARFGQPEVNLGIIPGFGGTQRLPRLVGRTKALELILTGEQITAQEALRIGLVNHVTAREELLPTAERMAHTIAQKAPLAVTAAKRALYEGLELSSHEGNLLETQYFGESVGTSDRKEGTSAFLEKRKPNWQGK